MFCQMTHRHITDSSVETNSDAIGTPMGQAFKALVIGNIPGKYETPGDQLLKVCAPEPILEKVSECAPLSPIVRMAYRLAT